MDNKIHTDSYIDTIQTLKSSRFNRKTSEHYGKTYWIAKCKEHEFKILESYLENKEFIKEIENNSIIGKTYVFSIIRRGKYLVRANIVE